MKQMRQEIVDLQQRAHTIAQFLVADIEVPRLDRDDEHHLVRVLRVRDGEDVSVIDGSGAWRICQWRQGSLRSTGPVVQREQPFRAPLRIAFPPLKADKTELVVQKLTELGIDVIQLLAPANAAVRLSGERVGKVMARLEKISKEAAMQARRTRLPEVMAPIDVTAAIAQGYVLAHWTGPVFPTPRKLEGGSNPRSALTSVAVGPEGGWTEQELTQSPELVGLGDFVLRAETAAIAAGVLLKSQLACQEALGSS